MTVTDIDILPNLRDLGGLPATDGRRTRPGVLYRSALPIAGDTFPTTVATWPARTVIDLRSPREFAKAPHPLRSSDTTVFQVPLMSDDDVSQPHQGRLIADVYQGVLDNSGPGLARILDIASTAQPPVLLHCAAGKDRTGIAIALLLRIAGVEPDDIVADYLSTNEHMDAVLARIARVAPELASTDRDLAGAVPGAIHGVLERWEAFPGGIVRWLGGHGATNQMLGRWVDRFTVSE
ncbi:tyrosine-protein phosphatase [Rhodococcus sp. JVH1]|uniref:tyrosine-protein phosphatase n=1 Tax=Rhodococcus sp. JVH1 TaxID=745408 RepID=UPI000271F027|nr:tyrosine-protein phosphatase [Rhodococcus sp. JVH1]EJI93561.1 protein tyrosine/serine phosphatase [Rhodococcus sp. JVH1]